MANILKNFDAKKTGIFAGGVLFGTAGIKILASDDAKKFYAMGKHSRSTKNVKQKKLL